VGATMSKFWNVVGAVALAAILIWALLMMGATS
jgi:hypothetical protein